MTITPRRNTPLHPKPDPMNHREGPTLPPDPVRQIEDTRLRVTALQLAENKAETPEDVILRAEIYYQFLQNSYEDKNDE